MYGVVICQGCKRPMGVNLQNKTATCNCGRSLKIGQLRIYFETDDPREIPDAIGKIAAERVGRMSEYRKLLKGPERRSQSVSAGGPKGSNRARVLRLIKELSRETGSFTLEEARKAFQLGNLGEPEPWIEELKRASILFEPQHGIFRFV